MKPWWKTEKVVEEGTYDVGLGIATITTVDGSVYVMKSRGAFEPDSMFGSSDGLDLIRYYVKTKDILEVKDNLFIPMAQIKSIKCERQEYYYEFLKIRYWVGFIFPSCYWKEKQSYLKGKHEVH